MRNLPITNPVLMGPINSITRRGLHIIDSKLGNNGRPIIEVDRPLSDWKDRSVQITERCQGQTRVLNMHIWRGAYILWA